MKRVLCVDDNVSICEVVTNLLDKAEVRSATTVAEGMELANSSTFDLFILDIQLPDGNGFDLLSDLRKLHPETPAVFITAATDISKEDAIRAGALDLIQKANGTFLTALLAISEIALGI